MKAKINGIEIEGTPSEIAELKFKLDEQSVTHGLAKQKLINMCTAYQLL